MDFISSNLTIENFVDGFAQNILAKGSAYNWEKVYPTGTITDKVILKHTIRYTNPQVFYLLIERTRMNGVNLQIGTDLNAEKNDLEAVRSSNKSRLDWYKERFNDNLSLWTPVTISMNIDEYSINLVVEGSPSVDSDFTNYLISYAYIGTLEPYEDGDKDEVYNYCLTSSSDTNPLDYYEDKFGFRTATGVTDISIVGTRTNTPYQAHYPKINTFSESMQKHFTSPSAWSHKFHMSEVVVGHIYDRERGKLRNVIVGDREGLKHLNKLVENRGLSNEENYIMYQINAPFSFLNNSPNMFLGVALKQGGNS